MEEDMEAVVQYCHSVQRMANEGECSCHTSRFHCSH